MRTNWGSLWMVVAGLMFAGTGVFVKLGGEHFSSMEMVLYRSLFGFVVVLAAVRARRLRVRSAQWRLHLLRSLVGFAGMGLLFYCIGVLPLTTATTLNYTSPLFLVALTLLVFKRRPGAGMVAAVAMGFAGVVLLLQPTFSADQAGAGLLGLLSGLCAGGAYLTTTQLGQRGEPPWRVVLYFTGVSTLVAGAISLASGLHPIGPHAALVLLGLGVCATLGQLCMTRAYQQGDTLTVGSLAYSTVVFTTLISIVVWDETVALSSWLAMALIIASGVLAIRISAGVAPGAPTSV